MEKTLEEAQKELQKYIKKFEKDKDGLIAIDELRAEEDPFSTIKDFYLGPCECQIHLPFNLPEYLLKIKDEKKGDVRIAPEAFYVFSQLFRCGAHLYGPEFETIRQKGELDKLGSNKDILTLLYHEHSDYSKTGKPLLRMEFQWKKQDGKSIFEAENLEFSAGGDYTLRGLTFVNPNLHFTGSDFFVNEYLHAILDKDNLLHIDGAEKIYTESEKKARQDLKLNECGKKTQKKKLFRVDSKGGLDINDFKEITRFYFGIGNPLVEEYLGIPKWEKRK